MICDRLASWLAGWRNMMRGRPLGQLDLCPPSCETSEFGWRLRQQASPTQLGPARPSAATPRPPGSRLNFAKPPERAEYEYFRATEALKQPARRRPRPQNLLMRAGQPFYRSRTSSHVRAAQRSADSFKTRPLSETNHGADLKRVKGDDERRRARLSRSKQTRKLNRGRSSREVAPRYRQAEAPAPIFQLRHTLAWASSSSWLGAARLQGCLLTHGQPA